MSLHRCAKCGGTASGVHDRDTDRWYCIDCAPPRLLLVPPKCGDSPRALAGVMGGMRAVMGRAPDGERMPRGALPWWWCYGNQPIAVKGAVYDFDDGVKQARMISEAQAQRESLRQALAQVAGDVSRLPPDQLAAALAMTPQRITRKNRGHSRRRAA